MSGVAVGAPYLMVAGDWADAPGTSTSPTSTGSTTLKPHRRPFAILRITILLLVGGDSRAGVWSETDLATRAQARVHDHIDEAAGQPLHLPQGDDVHALREVVGHGSVVRHPGHAHAGGREAVPAQDVGVGRPALVRPGRVGPSLDVFPASHARLHDPVPGVGVRARHGHEPLPRERDVGVPSPNLRQALLELT